MLIPPIGIQERKGPIMGFKPVGLMSTWFQEITVIDAENLPEGQYRFMASGGLFDKMLTSFLKQYAFDGILIAKKN